MTKTEFEEWVAERFRRDNLLYARFGKPLETEHAGEYVAISDGGQVILGKDEMSVSTRAIEEFGGGHFALRRIGAEFELSVRAVKE